MFDLSQVKLRSTGGTTREKKRRAVHNERTGETEVQWYWAEVDMTGRVVREIPVGEIKKEAAATGKPRLQRSSDEDGHAKPVWCWDDARGRWVKYERHADPARGATDVDAAVTLKLVTYNTWFGPLSGKECELWGFPVEGEEAIGEDVVKVVVPPAPPVPVPVPAGRGVPPPPPSGAAGRGAPPPPPPPPPAKGGAIKSPPSLHTKPTGTIRVYESLAHRTARYTRLLDEILARAPDVVTLQEVQGVLLDAIRAHPKVRESYGYAYALRGGTFEYGLCTLVAKSHLPVAFRVYDYTGFTEHNRMALVGYWDAAQTGCGGVQEPSLAIVNTHLDSLGAMANRTQQLAYVMQRLGVDEERPVIIAGDMNFGETRQEQRIFDGTRNLHLFDDAWTLPSVTKSRGDAAGGATMEHDDFSGESERIDRVFVNRRCAFRPVAMGIIGKSRARPDALSDHYGLEALFEATPDA